MATQTQTAGVLPQRGSRSGLINTFVALFALAVVINGGVMVWVWLKDGGVTQVHNFTEFLLSFGRITGLVGAYMALLQVLLLARLPPLERRIGLERLTVWHRRNGKLVIYLVVIHVVTSTIGYAQTAHTGLWLQFKEFLNIYPGMVTATVGTALMLLTVVSSLVIARRRLPYEAWYGVHLTVYAGIVLAYLHQIPSGTDFFTSTVQSDWWIALYVVTLALLLIYRVLLPLRQFVRLDLHVSAVERVGPDVSSITITGKHLESLGAVGGQFMLWRFMSKGLWWQSHPFSLSAAPNGRALRITVKAVGGYTRMLQDVPVGTRVLAEGPFGRFIGARRQRRRVTMIAGGIGVTPLRSIFEELSDAAVTFIYRAVDDADLVLHDEITQLAKERGAQVHDLVGDHRDPRFAELLSSKNLIEICPDIASSDVYLCGPVPMMHHAIENLKAAGVPKHQIHWEAFAFAA